MENLALKNSIIQKYMLKVIQEFPSIATAVDKAASSSTAPLNSDSTAKNSRNLNRDFDGFASASKAGLLRNVSIVVCVYNQAQMLRLCFDQLANFAPKNSEIIVVDDASQEDEVRSVIKHFEEVFGSRLKVVKNKKNLGYTKSANIGANEASDNHDLVFLNSDALITSRTIQTLQVVAESSPAIATVSPVSDNAGAFTVSSTTLKNPISSKELFDFSESFKRQENVLFTEVPTTNGFCMFIKRSAWRRLGGFDEELFPRGYGEENDFCLRAISLGYVNALTSKAFVYHRKSQSFGKESFDLKKKALSVVDEKWPSYRSMRKGFGRPYLDQINPSPAVKELRKRILLVMPIISGGAAQTNHELFTALSNKFDIFVLQVRPNKTVIWQINDEVASTPENLDFNGTEAFLGSGNKDYDSAFLSLLVDLSIDLVHVAHLAWQSTNISKISSDLGVPITYTLHDFESACPSVYLTNSKMQFCGGNCNSVEKGCSPSLEPLDRFPNLWNSQVFGWREKRKKFLDNVDKVFAPSAFAARTAQDVFPEITSKTEVIAHVLRTEIQSLDVVITADGPWKILILGNMTPLKGRNIVQELARTAGASIEIHHFGGNSFNSGSGITSHGPYKQTDLSKRVAQVNPNVALIPSLVPETFSRVLSECVALGIPVIVPEMGALGERVLEHEIGATYQPHSDKDKIVKSVIKLLEKNEWHFKSLKNLEHHKKLVSGPTPFEEWVLDYRTMFENLT